MNNVCHRLGKRTWQQASHIYLLYLLIHLVNCYFMQGSGPYTADLVGNKTSPRSQEANVLEGETDDACVNKWLTNIISTSAK